ncbi:MAG: DUF1553 domain-containing protein [Phycisphaeraceae bacterium]|nr:DUF1553 domain-containing protein [Phycisphaerales bacterium]QOJ17948.1 MAG: DUF1553 domain-containing protein [Phycisphaeraceae bacterium]
MGTPRRAMTSFGLTALALSAGAIGLSSFGSAALSTRYAAPGASFPAPSNEGARGSEIPSYNRQVRPILSDKCFKCHGPDSAARQGGLRLDSFDGATALREGWAAIMPGDPDASELIRRVSSADPDEVMPPPSEHKSLTAAEVDILRRWIAAGASYEPHWSFIPPIRPASPAVRHAGWVRNPVDQFILARLEREGLSPSPEADRRTLIRRLSLDLTGLPPTVEEIEAYLADTQPGADERLIDRLLASTRHAEHMARIWLDAARFGDTHGLHLDNYRSMWRWRDWVIDAYRRNMPFNQFTIEQLAGDLLPEPTLEQRIASGFHRNNVTTSEGGAIDAEYLVKYAVDRAETTGTVWLGLTVGCAACHDHKFDPITQREFYQFFAFFNNVAENAMDGNRHDPPPVMRAPTAEQARELDVLRDAVRAIEERIDAADPAIDAAQEAWESRWRTTLGSTWQVLSDISVESTGGTAFTRLEDGSYLASGVNPDRDTYEIVARIPEGLTHALRLEALTHESLPHNGPGRADNANFVLSEVEVTAVSTADPARSKPVEFVMAAADHSQTSGEFLVRKAIDGVTDAANGWAVEGYARREPRVALFIPSEPIGFENGTELRIRLRHETQFKGHGIGRFRLSVAASDEVRTALAPSVAGPWHMVGPFAAEAGVDPFLADFAPEKSPGQFDEAQVFEGGRAWRPRPEFIDGKVHMLSGEQCATYLAREIHCDTARRVAVSLGSDDSIRVWVNGRAAHDQPAKRPVGPDQDRITIDLSPGRNVILLKVVNYSGGYGFFWSPGEHDHAHAVAAVLRLLERDPATLATDERESIRRFFRRNHSPAIRGLYDDLAAAEARMASYEQSLPVTLVMQEQMTPRPTHVLHRGEYDKPLDRVMPGIPAALGAIESDGAASSRLDLARWLADRNNPLTARVVVNRLWQQMFGIGLVSTAEDFGLQGEWPSHPDLLDWLAVEFVESGWDVRHMLRLMALSATYRQSSRVALDLLGRDPANRLLARGGRFRLDAEVIRDQALFISGLLVEKVGGPSVKPYQPPGIWEAVSYPSSDTARYRRDSGESLYRRSMYTFWKRTAPPANLTTFDAPSRETCTVQRVRTNTPLQQLVLMNDPQFVEAARGLAQRALLRSGALSDVDRLAWVFEAATSRTPATDELDVLLRLLATQRERFSNDADAAARFIGVGESKPDPSLAPAELAAWTTVTGTILMLDEVITRN